MGQVADILIYLFQGFQGNYPPQRWGPHGHPRVGPSYDLGTFFGGEKRSLCGSKNHAEVCPQKYLEHQEQHTLNIPKVSQVYTIGKHPWNCRFLLTVNLPGILEIYPCLFLFSPTKHPRSLETNIKMYWLHAVQVLAWPCLLTLHIGYSYTMPPCTSIRDQVIFKDIKDPIAELDGRFWNSNL